MNTKIDMERFIGFITGDAIVVATFVHSEDIVKTIVLGFVGGIVGIFAKDVYSYLKTSFKNKIKKTDNDDTK